MKNNEDLTPRERVNFSLSHKTADRVPLDFGGHVSGIHNIAYRKLLDFLGRDFETEIYEIEQQLVQINEEILEEFSIDTRYVHIKFRISDVYSNHDADFYTDEWGVIKYKKRGGYFFELYKSPLENAGIGDVENYEWLDEINAARYNGLREKAKCFATKGFAVITNLQGIFEKAWELRGIQNMFEDLIANQEFVEVLFEKILSVYKKIYGYFLDICGEFLDIVQITDDLGTQDSLLMSPFLYRRLLKPRHKELVDFIKDKTPARIAIHTDGSMMPLIEDLIEVGFEVLNPVQVSAKDMDTRELKEKYGNRLSFWGAIDTQWVLPFGSTQDVRNEVIRRISDLGRNGGYILAPVHNILPEVPPENIWTMFDTARTLVIR